MFPDEHMQKTKINIMRWLFFTFLLSVIWFQPVYAEGTVARLTLHVYGNSLTGSSGGNLGHAFLSIRNISRSTLNFLDYPIPAKTMITVSIWPDKMSPIKAGGVYINREMVICKNVENSSISIDITQEQLNKIINNTPKESYYHDGQDDVIVDMRDDIWHNCTTYSTKMWNLVAPEKYKITDGFLGIDAPKWVSKKINKMEDHQNGKFTVSQKVDSTNVFYVTKGRELIPIWLETPKFEKKVNVSKNSISLKWNSTRKQLLNKQCNITGYEVKYSLWDGTETKIKKFSSNSGTIRNLKYGKQYKCQVRAVCKKGDITVYSDYSDVKTVRTANPPKASIQLSRSQSTIYKGKYITLKATVTGASKKVTWKSSNSRVASVSSTGKVTAKSAGKAVISATANGKTAKCTVTVKNVSSSSKKAQHKKYVSYIKAFHTKNFNAYMEWVYEGLIQPGDSDPVTYFAFMDIDGDGTDECMVRFCFSGGSMTTAPGGARSELYTIRSGKVKKVVEQGAYGSGSYPQIGVYRGSRLVEFETSGHMRIWNEFFAYQNGTLSSRATYSCMYGVDGYFVENKTATKAKYNSYLNKIKKGKSAYPMYRYTTANLNKFL